MIENRKNYNSSKDLLQLNFKVKCKEKELVAEFVSFPSMKFMLKMVMNYEFRKIRQSHPFTHFRSSHSSVVAVGLVL